MAEETHGSPSLDTDTDAKQAAEPTASVEDIESRITTAMRSRVGHFKEQSEYVHTLSLYLAVYFLHSITRFSVLNSRIREIPITLGIL